MHPMATTERMRFKDGGSDTWKQFWKYWLESAWLQGKDDIINRNR